MADLQTQSQIKQTQIEEFSRDISQVLENVPEVAKTCQWMRENSTELTAIVQSYAELIAKLDNYQTADLDWVKRAHARMNEQEVGHSSASTLQAATFLSAPTNQASLSRTSFRTTAIQAFNSRNVYYDAALAKLGEMMYQGHLMFSEGGTPKDGDPRSDQVIWGHTQAKDDTHPSVLAHFIVSHHLSQFFAKAHTSTDFAHNKDAFLAVVTDAMLMEETKSPSSTNVLKVWLTPRESGGLGWLFQAQLEAYQDTNTH